MYTTILHPNADSTPLQWSTDVFPVTHFSRVDDDPPDEDSSYLNADANNKIDVFEMQDLFVGDNPPPNHNIIINRAIFYSRARKTTADLNILKCDVYPYNWTYSISYSLPALATSYSTFSWKLDYLGTIFSLRLITISDVNSVRVAIKSIIPAGVRNNIRNTQVKMDITSKQDARGKGVYTNSTC